ncbi:MAG TPA: efflux RND transporter periplasmic adaptor subunit [Anaeromyxobacter sp.]
MRRVVTVLAVLVAVLGGLIALRLWRQAQALAAPSGGSGEIEGTRIDLSSRVGARILEQRVREGDRVKAGDLLLRLDCADPQAQLAEAEARAASAKAQVVALEAQRGAAERQAKRLSGLPADVAASNIDQTQAGAQGLGHQTDAARAQVRAGEAAVARARLLVAECEIRAPRDAEVATLPHEAGELVSPGAVLARLVDLSEVKATFYLPNAEVGVVKPGARAEVVADAWPGESFEGTVRTVALEAEFTPRNIQTRTDRDRLVYPVEVVVKNRDGKLRAGMPVQVTLPGTGR